MGLCLTANEREEGSHDVSKMAIEIGYYLTLISLLFITLLLLFELSMLFWTMCCYILPNSFVREDMGFIESVTMCLVHHLPQSSDE